MSEIYDHDCTRCPLHETARTVCVPGDGDPQYARAIVLGDMPGANEDRKGWPFIGPAGKILHRNMLRAGIQPSRVFLTHTVKCRPPENREPLPSEVDACWHYLGLEVASMPELQAILCLGRVAAKHVLGFDGTMKQMRGRWFTSEDDFDVMVTHDPAFILRQPKAEADFFSDLKLFEIRIR
jgi:uracil-DNA glycosylase family 4